MDLGYQLRIIDYVVLAFRKIFFLHLESPTLLGFVLSSEGGMAWDFLKKAHAILTNDEKSNRARNNQNGLESILGA